MAGNRAGELSFEPPGPGPWELDPVHFPRPVTRYFAETQPPAFRQGTRDFARFYGMLIDGMQMAYVNDIGYNQMVPVSEAEVPQRIARASEVFPGKLWREQLREWDEERKPASISRHRELLAVNPDELSEQELIDYLHRCSSHHAAMVTQHMRFTAAALLPTGDFLVHAMQWTGLPLSELLSLLRGAAPVSAGASEELARLRTAFGNDARAREVLEADKDADEVLADLRALSGEAGEAVRAYLDLVGYRLVDGFDIAEPCALEIPDALLRAMRIAVEGGEDDHSATEQLTAEIRGLVPPERQAEFDDLLTEARLTYRLRDERGVYSDIWASGIMRRAVLAAGRRVAARGAIRSADQMLDAGIDEMVSLISGSGGPTAAELAARADYRASHSSSEAPPKLGPDAPPPPDLSVLPPHVGRLMGAAFIAIGQVFGGSLAANEDKVLFGLAASKGVYEGLARRVAGPSEFGRIKKGDVLVTESTSEAFNILLPLLGAIVTDNGGLLSHAAIVAREYGIPGVVGTREATAKVPDGVSVRVDGDGGEVTILE